VLLNGFAGPKERDARVRTPNRAEINGLNDQRDGAFTHEQSLYRKSLLPAQHTKSPTPAMAQCYSQMVYGCRDKKNAATVALVAAKEQKNRKRLRGIDRSQ
jgi:hypothetical protein